MPETLEAEVIEIDGKPPEQGEKGKAVDSNESRFRAFPKGFQVRWMPRSWASIILLLLLVVVLIPLLILGVCAWLAFRMLKSLFGLFSNPPANGSIQRRD